MKYLIILLLCLLLPVLVSAQESFPDPGEMTELEIIRELQNSLSEREANLNAREAELEQRELRLNEREATFSAIQIYLQSLRDERNTERLRYFLYGAGSGLIVGAFTGFQFGITIKVN